MKIQNTVYFRDSYGNNIEKADAGKIVAMQDSEGLYSVLLMKDKQIYKVHPKCISILKPMGTSIFKSLELNGSPSVRKKSTKTTIPTSMPTMPSITKLPETTPSPERVLQSAPGSPKRIYPSAEVSRASSTSTSTTQSPRPRRNMQDIKADIVRRHQEQRQMMRQKYGSRVSSAKQGNDEPSISDISVKTEDISLVSHPHGRQRRSERNIQRKELQAAIKYGKKETANPGRDGSRRWRYTHNGVVFITDETSRHEVTSWRISGQDEDDSLAPAQVQLDGSKSHAVLVVDHSGSMRNSDVPGYKSRAHAVYECLKRDFVGEQLKAGAATDVVVTLIAMNDTATVLLNKKPFDESLIDDLHRLSKRQPKSHGHYIPALDKALEVMRVDAEDISNVLLLFFSDGAPSDQQNMKCSHGINLFRIIHTQKTDRTMQHVSRNKAYKCMNEITNRVETECCQRVKSIGEVFGPDKVIFRTLAFGPSEENFEMLEKMANVLPRGEFQKLGLDASNLKTSFSSLGSSLSILRTEGGNRVLTRRSDKVVDENQEVDHSALKISGQDGWWMYAHSDLIGKYEFNCDDPSSRRLERTECEDGINGIAFLQHPFAEGAERFVYRCTEIKASIQDYHSAASSANVAERCGLRLVAKEAKDLENHHQGRKFHERFSRIQADAGKLARSFTKRLPHARPEWNVSFLSTTIYGCYDDSYREGQAWILVEPELDGKFTKWNDNAGNVRSQTLNQNIGALVKLDESDDEDEDEEAMAPIEIGDVPQTFSHFSYEFSKGRQLVCDLQGVHNEYDGYTLTDPVIHFISSRGRKHINGATDKGEVGMKKFFETHVCNSLCKRMGLQERTPDTLISVASGK